MIQFINSKLLRICLFAGLCFGFGNVLGQSTPPLQWECHRKVFNSIITKNGDIQYSKMILENYRNENAFKSIQLYKRSKIFLPASPVFVLGGIYLGYDAIKGTKKVAYIDGVAYTYYIRPIKQLIAGIGVFAVGVCLLEYSNEFKSRSVELMNEKIKLKPKGSEFDIKLGFTPTGNFGLSAKF